ncbi:MAG: hypothetical protein ACYC7F_03450 [Gemmatimonadaceae bacterium]
MITAQGHITRKPLALAAGIAILIFGHSAMQESAATWLRSLPVLLILILGELVRERTVSRLSPSLDEPTVRARRRLRWLSLTAGIGFLALPVGALLSGMMSKYSPWAYAYLAASIISFGVLSAVLLVEAKGRLDARLAEAARSGVRPEHSPPGPFTFMLVLAAALVVFAIVNASNIESLVAGRAFSAMQWVRVLVSALICGGFAFIAWRAMNTFSDRLLNPTSPEAG